MRALVLLVALAGCRNALGIPSETRVESFAIRGTVEGVRGASADVIVALETHGVTVTQDGAFAIENVPNGLAGTLVAGPACKVVGAAELVVDAEDITDIVVKCDGLLSLASIEASAPLDIAFDPRVTDFVATGSLVTQRTAFTFATAYPSASASALFDGSALPAAVQLTGTHELEVTVNDGSQTFPPRRYRMTIETIAAPEPFAYGKPAEVAPQDGRYGASVATDGDLLVVGMPNAADGGRIVIHRRTGTRWDEETTLAGAMVAGDGFGSSVALAGTLLVVGAPGEAGIGAVYVFEYDGTQWTRTARTAGTAAGDEYGASVAISGTRVVIGVPGANAIRVDNQLVPLAGAQPGDRFGHSVALSADGSKIAAGAPGRDGTGAAYVIDAATRAIAATLVAPQRGTNDRFGEAVAIDAAGARVVVGAPLEDSLAISAGAVYVFTAPVWTATILHAPNADVGDSFGSALAIRNNVLAVGAPYEDSGTAANLADESRLDAGAVYIYDLAIGDPPHFSKASNPGPNDAFGTSLALSSEMLAVGAPYEDSAASGWNGNGGDGSVDTGAVYALR